MSFNCFLTALEVGSFQAFEISDSQLQNLFNSQPRKNRLLGNLTTASSGARSSNFQLKISAVFGFGGFALNNSPCHLNASKEIQRFKEIRFGGVLREHLQIERFFLKVLLNFPIGMRKVIEIFR